MKEQFIKNAQTAFLRDTVQFYNSGNRAMRPETTVCVYEPTEFSPGCAIGRHLPNKKLCRSLCGTVDTVCRNGWGDVFGSLLVLGVGFLNRVQRLHDNYTYWDGCGLAPYGRAEVSQICVFFGLDIEQIFPPAE